MAWRYIEQTKFRHHNISSGHSLLKMGKIIERTNVESWNAHITDYLQNISFLMFLYKQLSFNFCCFLLFAWCLLNIFTACTVTRRLLLVNDWIMLLNTLLLLNIFGIGKLRKSAHIFWRGLQRAVNARIICHVLKPH